MLSLLSGEEIKERGLVLGSTDDNLFRASTYDLSVGEIIPASGRPGGTEYTVPAGGTLRVVSKELLKLPPDITGHALLKNDLCRKGVLAIHIGVIDPGFEGPISSTLINFGRGDFIVRQGAPFLRISFYPCTASPKADYSAKHTQEQYLSNVRDEVMAYMAPTFLNLDETTKRAAEEAFGSFKNHLIFWATGVALVIALLAIFAPLGASFVEKYLTRPSQQDLEQTVEKKARELYEDRLKLLSTEIESLKAQQKPGHAAGSK